MTYNYDMDRDGYDTMQSFLDNVDAFDSDGNDPLLDAIQDMFEMDELSNEYEIDWDQKLERSEITDYGCDIYVPLKLK